MGLPRKTRVFWTIYKRLEGAPVMQQPPEKVRAASERRKRMLGLPGSALLAGRADRGAEITERTFTLDDGTTIPLRVYRPRAGAGTPVPAVVNFHGGGWVSGDARQSEWWCSSIAARAGVVVVSVDYRLAPEHPYPIAAEDCYAATAWVAKSAGELGVDPQRVAVMGDSAGGNLAAVVSLMARDRGGPPLAGQLLLYPAVDLGADYPSATENAHAPILSKRDVDTTWRMYVQGDSDPAEPYASPLNGRHEGLPPALIQTAEFDPLRDQGPAYAGALKAARVPVRLTNYVGAVHGFASLPGVVPAAHQAVAEAVDWLRELLAAS